MNREQIYDFDPMSVEESVVLRFPFDDELVPGVTLTGTPAVTVTQVAGGTTDPTPQDLVADVTDYPANGFVEVAILGRFKSATYEIRVTHPTSNPLLRLCRIGHISVF